MQPTYHDGNVLLGRKWGTPKTGEIVTAYVEDLEHAVVKRVIATEGDLFVVMNNEFFINGEKVGKVHNYFQGELEMKVPKKKYYLMGDNKGNSLDSRDFGFVDRKDITGIVIKKLY